MEILKAKLESGFKIVNILLLESNFTRIENVNFSDNIKHEINVDLKVGIDANVVTVVETVFFKQLSEELIEEVSCTIKMIGVFEKFGESPLDLEHFGHINGAAIIFPYIREHFSNLSSKAGLGLIFLPPFNFTKKDN